MLKEDTAAHLGTTAHRWSNVENDRGAGPQGAALILELQRLRHALEHEHDEVRPSPESRRPSSPPTRRKPANRRRKGKIGRVIGICLEQFGLASPGPVRGGDPQHAAGSAPPQRQREGDGGSDASFLIDPERDHPRSNAQYQSMHVESPRMELPPPVGGTPSSPMANQLVSAYRNWLSAPISFILNSDGGVVDQNAADGGLMIRTGRALEHELRTGLRVLLIVGFLAGGWATLAPLAGAVIAGSLPRSPFTTVNA
jgi:HlyD family secretion protein